MSDYETVQRKRNIIVGLFVIVALCALALMIYTFGDVPMAVSSIGSYQVRVQFPTATGIQEDTPVRFCGYQIGRVTSVEPPRVMKDRITDQFYHQTLIVLSIANRHKDIPADVEAKLMTRGLGSSYIELKLKQRFDVKAPTGPFLDPNSVLQGSTGMTSEFFPEESQKKLEQLVDGISTFIGNANDVIGDANSKQNLKKTFANLAEASERAVQAVEQATRAAEELRKFAAAGTGALNKVDGKVDDVVGAFVQTSEQLSKTLAELRVILEKVNSGQGSAGKLVNDARLYEGLLENTERLEELLQEIKAFVAEARSKGVPLKLK